MDPMNPERAMSFGASAEEYDRWRPSYPDEAVDWVVPVDASVVVDVGAGTGKLTGSLLARGLQVEAVEPDARMLAVLERRYPDARAHQTGAGDLPCADTSVDAVLAADAWHWFPFERAVAETRRVLRPGGWLGLMWNVVSPRSTWGTELARLNPDYRLKSTKGGGPFPPEEIFCARWRPAG